MENKTKKVVDTVEENYIKAMESRLNELNRINTELIESESIEKFASSSRIARAIAHDVRNPLTNISLATEQLKQTNPQNSDTNLLLGMIDRNVSRINQILSDLLYATTIENLEYAPADINQLLNETLYLAQTRIELNHIKVDRNFDKNVCVVFVDKEKIKLAFLNLIVNAVEAMDNKTGILEIKTLTQGDKCVIEFKDNGTGIDAETMQKVFEPYFTSKMKGNGLGLTHTQNIIVNHKGNITVNSKKGHGSTFNVTLNLNHQKIN